MDEPTARALLMIELEHTYLPGVLRNCPILATDVLQTSTLKRKINVQDWEGAAEQLMLWTKGGGRELPGLVKRRKAEKELILI